MQRICTKLRSLALESTQRLSSLSSSRWRLHSSLEWQRPLHFATTQWSSGIVLNRAISLPNQCPSVARSSLSSSLRLSLIQVRCVSSRERAKKRKPMTPVTSKVKKIKMKSYSSYKSRFKTLSDGTIRRWREGKRHNAHLKEEIMKESGMLQKMKDYCSCLFKPKKMNLAEKDHCQSTVWMSHSAMSNFHICKLIWLI